MDAGRSLLDLGGLLMDLRDLFDGPADVVTATSLGERVRARVLNEAVRSDSDRAQDIVEAIDRIHRYTIDGCAALEDDELIQVWMARHLQIIGEAAGRLSDDTRSQRSNVPSRKIIGMRHVLVHGYFEVDLDLVWAVVENDLGPLRKAIVTLIDTTRSP